MNAKGFNVNEFIDKMTDEKRPESIKTEGKTTGVPSVSSTPRTPSTPGVRGVDEYQKKTFIVKTDYVEQIKKLAYLERREIKEIVNEALKQYLKKHKSQEEEKCQI